MKVKFQDEPKKIKTQVHPPCGNFALEVDPSKDVHWDHCREQFAAKFDEHTIGFYFSHPHGKSIDVGEFISKFETVLGIQSPSKFAKTEKQTVLWIEPSSFWKSCQIKRSLLTIIIRCAMNYDLNRDNFDDALFGDYKESTYIKETKFALLRFMFGFTQFTGKLNTVAPTATVIKQGWREEFINANESVVRRKLTLPEGFAKDISIVGVDSLWT